jgi:hypothetical protein
VATTIKVPDALWREFDTFADKNLTFENYPNGNGGWEQKRGGRAVMEVCKEFADKHGLTVRWRAGNPHVCSSVVMS